MALRELPRIDVLVLGVVNQVPDWHPEHATFEPFPVHAWVIRHPDGSILVDTGIGMGNPLIDEWYRPDVTDLDDALGGVGLEPSDIGAVVLSHLHFDHCGQQQKLDAPVYVQADEHEQAKQRYYTIEEWATIPPERLRLVHGDEELADGVRILATPGHTPGHQSVVITSATDCIVLGGQCAYRADEVRTGEPGETNLHDPSWRTAACDSLARIRELQPSAVHLSHDPEIVNLTRSRSGPGTSRSTPPSPGTPRSR